MLWLCYDSWHGKSIFCCHFFYVSKNSLMSSFSSSVKTTSQQFRSICLIAIFGMFHDISPACFSSGGGLSSSWPLACSSSCTSKLVLQSNLTVTIFNPHFRIRLPLTRSFAAVALLQFNSLYPCCFACAMLCLRHSFYHVLKLQPWCA